MTLSEHDVEQRISAALRATAEAVADGRFETATPAAPAGRVFDLRELAPARQPIRHRVQRGRLAFGVALSGAVAGLAVVIALLVANPSRHPVRPGGDYRAPSHSSQHTSRPPSSSPTPSGAGSGLGTGGASVSDSNSVINSDSNSGPSPNSGSGSGSVSSPGYASEAGSSG